MTMGTGVVLFVIGAILAFAVRLQNAFIDFGVAGYVLMAAGAIVFIVGLALAIRGRRSVTTTTAAAAPGEPVGAASRTTRTTGPEDF